MRDPDRAKRALGQAESTSDAIERSLWLAQAVSHGILGRAVLVGGAAVNLYTGSYVPTDIAMCAYLDEADRASLRNLGFRNLQGGHFEYSFADGESWPVEFPDSQVDGNTTSYHLGADESLEVISLESLIVDRLIQATDPSGVTFDEAVRLAVATFPTADWEAIGRDVARRESSGEISGLNSVLQRVYDQARPAHER